MPTLISISLQCPQSQYDQCTFGILTEEYSRNNVEVLVTGSNNPAAPVQEQTLRIRRAHSSQKMRRGLTSRAPTDVIATFLNSKITDFPRSAFSTAFF
jgi:hypothetical protein